MLPKIVHFLFCPISNKIIRGNYFSMDNFIIFTRNVLGNILLLPLLFILVGINIEAQNVLKRTIYVEENPKVEEDVDTAIERQMSSDTEFAASEYSKILKISSDLITRYRTSSIEEFKILNSIVEEYKKQNINFVKEEQKNQFYISEIFKKFPPTFITPQQLELMLKDEKPLRELWNITNQDVAQGLYIGMQEYTHSLLNQLPADAKKKLIYDSNYQKTITSAWTSANPQIIEEFIRKNPLQIHQPDIMLHLGDIYFSLGRMSDAFDAWYTQQKIHGATALLVAKMATAAYLNNDLYIYQHFVKHYRKNRGKIIIADEKMFLGKYLRKIPVLFNPAKTYNWTSFGGNNSHNAVVNNFSFSTKTQGNTLSLSNVNDPKNISLPIFANGHLYLRLPNELICYEINDILPKKRWSFSHIPIINNPAIKNVSDYMTVTYANGVIYLFTGDKVDYKYPKLLTTTQYHKIYAIDATNGKILWTWSGEPNTHFCFAPVIIGNKLYASATQFKKQTNVEVYCFDIQNDLRTQKSEEDYNRNGKLLWKQFIVSALENDYLDETVKMTIAGGITAGYGKLYCISNIGVVAAVDLKDGHIHWLNKYHSHVQQKYQLRSNAVPRKISWQNVPPIVKNGKIYVTPTDSDKLHIYNCFTGALERTFPDNTQNNIFDRVIGVGNDGTVYLAGASSYKTQIIALQENQMTEKLWEKDIIGIMNGMPILGEKYIYISTGTTRNNIYKIDIKTGSFALVNQESPFMTKLLHERRFPCSSFMTFFQQGQQYLLLSGQQISILKNH